MGEHRWESDEEHAERLEAEGRELVAWLVGILVTGAAFWLVWFGPSVLGPLLRKGG